LGCTRAIGIDQSWYSNQWGITVLYKFTTLPPLWLEYALLLSMASISYYACWIHAYIALSITSPFFWGGRGGGAPQHLGKIKHQYILSICWFTNIKDTFPMSAFFYWKDREVEEWGLGHSLLYKEPEVHKEFSFPHDCMRPFTTPLFSAFHFNQLCSPLLCLGMFYSPSLSQSIFYHWFFWSNNISTRYDQY